MRYKHIDGVAVRAQFSEENKPLYRYRLEITLQDASAQGTTACVVMQNPSVASTDKADKSVQFMEKVVFQKKLPEFDGVQRLIVVNQFAYIQTNDFQGLPQQIGENNNAAIKAAFRESDIIIIAWGAGNSFEDRKEFVLGLLKQMEGKKLLMTKMHPSRGRYDGFIQPFCI
jgi:hypothetical protein